MEKVFHPWLGLQNVLLDRQFPTFPIPARGTRRSCICRSRFGRCVISIYFAGRAAFEQLIQIIDMSAKAQLLKQLSKRIGVDTAHHGVFQLEIQLQVVFKRDKFFT